MFVLLIDIIIEWQLKFYLKGTKTSKHPLFSLHLNYKNIQPLGWVGTSVRHKTASEMSDGK